MQLLLGNGISKMLIPVQFANLLFSLLAQDAKCLEMIVSLFKASVTTTFTCIAY